MALIPYKPTDDTKMAAIAWGEVSSDPYYSRVGANETPKASFYLRYYSEKDEATGKWTGKTILCEFWRELADTACKLEKRDKVFIVGTLEKDEYRSEKSGETQMVLTADFFAPQALVNVFVEGVNAKSGILPPEDTSNILMDEETGDILFG